MRPTVRAGYDSLAFLILLLPCIPFEEPSASGFANSRYFERLLCVENCLLSLGFFRCEFLVIVEVQNDEWGF